MLIFFWALRNCPLNPNTSFWFFTHLGFPRRTIIISSTNDRTILITLEARKDCGVGSWSNTLNKWRAWYAAAMINENLSTIFRYSLFIFPANIYLFKVIDVVLVFLFLTLNIFHTFFWCFYCWVEQVDHSWVNVF